MQKLCQLLQRGYQYIILAADKSSAYRAQQKTSLLLTALRVYDSKSCASIVHYVYYAYASLVYIQDQRSTQLRYVLSKHSLLRKLCLLVLSLQTKNLVSLILRIRDTYTQYTQYTTYTSFVSIDTKLSSCIYDTRTK